MASTWASPKCGERIPVRPEGAWVGTLARPTGLALTESRERPWRRASRISMARKAQFEKVEKQQIMIARFRAKRTALVATMKNIELPFEEREAARIALSRIPKDAHPNRLRRRCTITGRSRANYRKFGICRIKLREMAHKGEIPGMRKASW